MAQIDLELNRIHDPDLFPDRCARCGAAGTTLIPVPERYTKKVEGLAVPLCPAHVDDWSAVRSRNRIGAVMILLAVAATMAAVWVLHPQFARPNEQNTLNRVAATISFGFVAALPLGIAVALWANSPIRVTEKHTRVFTLDCVCGDFVKATESNRFSPALRSVSDDVRFEVSEYRPARTCPPEVAGRLLAVTLDSAAVLGLLIGLLGLEFGRFTDGWHRNDWRYLGLIALVTAAYLVPLLGLRFLLISRTARLVIVMLIGFIAIGSLLLRIFGGSFQLSFGIVFTGGALGLLAILVVQRFTSRWHVRSVPVAVAAAAGGPLVLTGIVYLIAGTEPGPHNVVYYLGPIVALASGLMNRETARAPYCAGCQEWLVSRRIGALPRSVAEIQPVLQAGQVIALAGVQPYDERAAIGDVEFTVYSCPHCREQGTVVLELQNCVGGGKSGKVPTLVKVGRWQYPGPVLLAVESMFPLPSDEPAKPPMTEANS